MKPRPTTHCLRGHDLTGANLYVRADGSRYCRACRDEKDRDRRRPVKDRMAVNIIASRPSDELIAEAQRRSAAPRDLTGMLLGDPPRGFSALDQMVAAPVAGSRG